MDYYIGLVLDFFLCWLCQTGGDQVEVNSDDTDTLTVLHFNLPWKVKS